MKLTIVTIGQSPRDDFDDFFPKNTVTRIEQIGVLDTYEEQLPDVSTENILVSRLRNGKQVKMDKDFVIKKVNSIVEELNKGDTNMILLACTGEFEKIPSSIPIVYPDKLVGNVIQSIFRNQKPIGVLVPDKRQQEIIRKKWLEHGIETNTFEISPYKYNVAELNRICKELNRTSIEYIICDCMGYGLEFKKILKNRTEKRVILSNEIVFNNIFSILS